MILPGVENALIEVPKVRDYLLSTTHRSGRFKAVFFMSLGYTARDWTRLASDLHTHAREGEARATESNGYGRKYEVRGSIEGPAGKRASLVTVWIVIFGEEAPRFVTAYPGVRS